MRSFQISAVFPHLTALENVRVALQRKRGDNFDFWRSKRALNPYDARARELLDEVGLGEFAGKLASEISYGRKRALEIATTLALEPEMMLLDEPMAGMGHEDIDRIVALIRRVSVNRTVLMVEHNLNVVEHLSDRITVLTRGRVLAEGDYATVSQNPDVKTAYLGVGSWLSRCCVCKGWKPGTANRTFCTASISRSAPARSSPCSAATAPARRRR